MTRATTSTGLTIPAVRILQEALQLELKPAEAAWLKAMHPSVSMRLGQRDKALALWRERQEDDFNPIIADLLKAYAGEDIAGDVTAVITAMDHSDQRRAQGDLRGAIAALSIGAVWGRQDLHPMSRLADLWLAITPENDTERYAQLRVFAEVITCKVAEVPPRGAIWDAERRNSIQQRAQEALESANPKR